jgi:hypothetical protein
VAGQRGWIHSDAPASEIPDWYTSRRQLFFI